MPTPLSPWQQFCLNNMGIVTWKRAHERKTLGVYCEASLSPQSAQLFKHICKYLETCFEQVSLVRLKSELDNYRYRLSFLPKEEALSYGCEAHYINAAPLTALLADPGLKKQFYQQLVGWGLERI